MVLTGEGHAVREEVDTGDILNRVAGLAARMAGASSAVVRHGGAVRARSGHAPDPAATLLQIPFPAAGAEGCLELARPGPARPLTETERAGLDDLVAVVAAVLAQERQTALLAEATDRAVRADRMHRLVTEAPSCTGALFNLLGELCRHHGASVGRIWRLLPDGTMLEESRFNATGHDAAPYYDMAPTAPVRAGNSWTAQAIMRNQPQAFVYADVADPDRFVLLRNAIASGLASQVSFPFWLGEERFGVSLAFTTARRDLDLVVADIAGLAGTISPALFRKVTEERVFHLAHHDGLTQLSNRIAFNESLLRRIGGVQGDGRFALLYLDLDGFKEVNDTHGHEAGDKLLVMVAQRLRQCVRDGEADSVARLGGDEFAIILPASPATASPATAPPGTADGAAGHDGPDMGGTALAQRVLHRFGEPFLIDGRATSIGVSVGIASFPADGDTPDALLRSADLALYECKRSGRRGFRVFDARLGARQSSRAAMRQEMEAALDAGQFGLAFQAIRETAWPHRVHALEALPHWRQAGRGTLPAAEFLPLVHDAGLDGPVGRWMLDAACRAAASWPEPWMLSVNPLPGQLRDPGLPVQLQAVLQDTGLPAGRLEVEVAEPMMLGGAALAEVLQGIRRLGVRLTLDGFGASHAGLGWLRLVAFDRIKLHSSCLAGLETAEGLALVQAVLALGRQLGMDVMADGVEAERDLLRLAGLGIGLAQGALTGPAGTWDASVPAPDPGGAFGLVPQPAPGRARTGRSDRHEPVAHPPPSVTRKEERPWTAPADCPPA